MKILLANSTCNVGGVSTFQLSLREALLRRGHECELFFFSGGSMVERLPASCHARFGSLAECLRLVARGGFHIVHANNVDWPKGIAAVRQLGVKLVLTAHKVRAINMTYGWTAGNCDALTAVSAWIARDLQPCTDVPIQVVPNGIDTERFTPSHPRTFAPSNLRTFEPSNPRTFAPSNPRTFAPSNPIVLWVGRGGSAHKRLDKFAAIAPVLKRAGMRVWVIDQHGPAGLRGTHPDAARLLTGAAERWEPVPAPAMPGVYREVAASGGCLVSTSFSEGLPFALLEAQACGCPVIASDVRGNNECVFTSHGGELYPFDLSAADVAALVSHTVADRSGAARGEEAARHVSAVFSLDHMADRYLRLYGESPYGATASLLSRVRARTRLTPVLHWSAYLEHCWEAGIAQLEASRELADAGEWRLAAAAAEGALRATPTLFARRERFAHLCRAMWKGGGPLQRGLASNRRDGPEPCTTARRSQSVG